MIRISNKKDCCGCSACAEKCPKQCITLKEDSEGFLYPLINQSQCIDCGLCEKVCPVINQSEKRLPLHTYAAINTNEDIRLQSSSGGIFTLLAEEVLAEKGVVFGACFDENWEVKHDYTESMEGLAVFRGSKYVQSQMGDNYKRVRNFLKQGRKVLFSGTPCQIVGLKRFLQKEYEDLLTVDFICHGVPSPKVWSMYLDETCGKIIEQSGKNSAFSALSNGKERFYIEAISFRYKILGWKKFSFLLKLNLDYIKGGKNSAGLCEPFSENIFMKGFLANLYLRPSCHQCAAKSGKSGSDITIADYWNIQQVMPEFDDDKGTGLVLINTSKGEKKYASFSAIESKETGYEEAQGRNGGFKEIVATHPQRQLFFEKLSQHVSITTLIKDTLKKSLQKQIQQKIKKVVRKIVYR